MIFPIRTIPWQEHETTCSCGCIFWFSVTLSAYTAWCPYNMVNNVVHILPNHHKIHHMTCPWELDNGWSMQYHIILDGVTTEPDSIDSLVQDCRNTLSIELLQSCISHRYNVLDDLSNKNLINGTNPSLKGRNGMTQFMLRNHTDPDQQQLLMNLD